MSIKIAIIGNLTPGVVAFIIICGLLILVGNRTTYIITAAVAALVLFIKVYGGGNSSSESHLLGSLLTLAVVIFGIYIMIRGFFRKSKKTGK